MARPRRTAKSRKATTDRGQGVADAQTTQRRRDGVQRVHRTRTQRDDVTASPVCRPSSLIGGPRHLCALRNAAYLLRSHRPNGPSSHRQDTSVPPRGSQGKSATARPRCCRPRFGRRCVSWCVRSHPSRLAGFPAVVPATLAAAVVNVPAVVPATLAAAVVDVPARVPANVPAVSAACPRSPRRRTGRVDHRSDAGPDRFGDLRPSGRNRRLNGADSSGRKRVPRSSAPLTAPHAYHVRVSPGPVPLYNTPAVAS